MKTWQKLVLIQFWLLIALPCCGAVLIAAAGPAGLLGYAFLFWLWAWEFVAYLHYRSARQEELVSLLQVAGSTNLPLESFLQAYIDDRPHKDMYRFWTGVLLFFVFPGYYWIHRQRSFDRRLERLVAMLRSGMTLDRALVAVPGIVTRETALAVAVGQFTDSLSESLHRLPDRRLNIAWLDLAIRLAYPVFVMFSMVGTVSFMLIFIIPKFEKIFMDFKMRLPALTEALISISRFSSRYAWAILILFLALLAGLNLLLFVSQVRWYFPGFGGFYRAHLRGEFLTLLGQMLESRRPLPDILDRVLRSQLLPGVMQVRVRGLRDDIVQGLPLGESLLRNGLATASMQALITSAQKANNLPWAVREIGESLSRQAVRRLERLALILFPVAVLLCGAVVAFVCISIFSPLTTLLENLVNMR